MNRQPKKLLDQVREVIQLKHYSIRTEEAYVAWIRRYILFHNKRHPQEMGSDEIETFLTHLAVDGQVAASTQNQAFHALLFLYRMGKMKRNRGEYGQTVCVTRKAQAALETCAHSENEPPLEVL